MNTLQEFLYSMNDFNYNNHFPLSRKREDDKNFYIDLEVPGYKKDDIDIKYQDNTIKIEGENKNAISFYSSDKRFTKKFKLINIEYKKINAELENGILTLTIPKSQEMIEKRKVTKIKIAGS